MANGEFRRLKDHEAEQGKPSGRDPEGAREEVIA
jgi:hypothetical protein